MAKLTAWLVTLIGVLFVLAQIWPDTFSIVAGSWFMWVLSLAVLAIGLTKLVRNYNK